MNLQSHVGTLLHLPVIGHGWSTEMSLEGWNCGTAQQLPIEYTWYENITNLLVEELERYRCLNPAT